MISKVSINSFVRRYRKMIRTDDDILVIEPTPLTPMQATEAVKVIRDFVITLEDSGEPER